MTSEVIKVKLKEAFNPDIIEIIDQSASHAGHSDWHDRQADLRAVEPEGRSQPANNDQGVPKDE